MGIQILQYEFLGPVPLADWGPPMEKLVYLVMSQDKDRYMMLYAGECEKTEDRAFFVQHPQFQCWAKRSSEERLHLAIFPEPDAKKRGRIVSQIVGRYGPPCNPKEAPQAPPYEVRRGHSCPCCGKTMTPEKKLASSTLYRCSGCGMSDTRLD